MSRRALPVGQRFLRAALLLVTAVSGCAEVELAPTIANQDMAPSPPSITESAVTPAPSRPVLLGRFEVSWAGGEPQFTQIAVSDSIASAAPLRTVRQASWCRGSIGEEPTDTPSVSYSWRSIPGSDVTETPGDTSEACVRTGDVYPIRGRGVRCYEHGIISHSAVPIRHVTLVVESIIPGGSALILAPEPPPAFATLDLVGLPPLALGVLYFGDIPPGGFAYQSFAYSRSDNAGEWLEYGVYAVIDEACNGVDDDCDGEVDEDGACE